MKTPKARLVEAIRHMARTGDPRKLLIEHLGFDHPEKEEIDRSKWSKEWEGVVANARFIADRSGFHVAGVTVKAGTPAKTWRSIATRIIVDYQGLAMVCVHGDEGLRWLWSSPSSEQLRTAAALAEGVRHITVEIREDGTASRGFVALLGEINVAGTSTSLEVLSGISGAFDHYTAGLQADIGKNAFEALRILSDGLLSHPANRLRRDLQTLEKIRPEVFILLYRLLFVLFAEDREIFPVDHPVYRDRYSLRWWRNHVTLPFERGGSQALSDFGGKKDTRLWKRCQGLFHLIMTGSELQGHKASEFGFRAYYGTIFDPELHSSLESWEIPNEFIAEAVTALTRFREVGGGTFFADYSQLEVRHLGSIYERLLEYHLAVDSKGNVVHTLDELERKATGSYFTPSSLIDRLVTDTLNPILDRIRSEVGMASPEAFEKAVYALRVCDPAMGSGHFLVGVLNHLARAVMDYRQGTGVSSGSAEELVEIKRTIIRRCLYGVDLNPLTVELAKMSLWLETVNSNRPLSFLDAHLKNGNSLVGAWFKSLEDPQRSLLGEDIREHLRSEVRELISIERQEEIEAVDVKHKVHQYRKIRSPDTRYGRLARLLDALVAPHFGVSLEEWRTARALLKDPKDFDEFTSTPSWKRADSVARRVGFFHWELEFPEVFYSEQGQSASDAGFDAVLGNPPWDRIRVADKEFFRHRAPEIANAQNAADMAKKLKRLREDSSPLWVEYEAVVKEVDGLAEFMRACGSYPLSTRGPLNYYPIFIERSVALVRRIGFVGMIAPTGLLTDFNNHVLLEALHTAGQLMSASDFENKGIFADIHAQFRFSLVTISKEGGKSARFAFQLHDPRELDDTSVWFRLSATEARVFNPNTRTIPAFRSRKDADLNLKMYKSTGGVLFREDDLNARNDWGVRGYQMVNMASDSHLFKSRKELARGGWKLQGNVFVKDGKRYLPLYEAKMVNIWNSRFATYHDATEDDARKGHCRDASPDELKTEGWYPLPRYWVPEKSVQELWKQVGWAASWVIVFRDITNPTNERTSIACVAPAMAFGHQAPVLITSAKARDATILVANLSTLPFDYCSRAKVSGTHMSFFILYQLPVFPPEAYARWRLDGRPLSEELSKMALCLSCTSDSLRPLAKAAGHAPEMTRWNDEERFKTMRLMDAIYARLYGLTRDEFAYVLDTFPIVRETEMQRYGTFRTKESALSAFDNLADRLEDVSH